jgi:hypothetical protein
MGKILDDLADKEYDSLLFEFSMEVRRISRLYLMLVNQQLQTKRNFLPSGSNTSILDRCQSLKNPYEYCFPTTISFRLP